MTRTLKDYKKLAKKYEKGVSHFRLLGETDKDYVMRIECDMMNDIAQTIERMSMEQIKDYNITCDKKYTTFTLKIKNV